MFCFECVKSCSCWSQTAFAILDQTFRHERRDVLALSYVAFDFHKPVAKPECPGLATGGLASVIRPSRRRQVVRSYHSLSSYTLAGHFWSQQTRPQLFFYDPAKLGRRRRTNAHDCLLNSYKWRHCGDWNICICKRDGSSVNEL